MCGVIAQRAAYLRAAALKCAIWVVPRMPIGLRPLSGGEGYLFLDPFVCRQKKKSSDRTGRPPAAAKARPAFFLRENAGAALQPQNA